MHCVFFSNFVLAHIFVQELANKAPVLYDSNIFEMNKLIKVNPNENEYLPTFVDYIES